MPYRLLVRAGSRATGRLGWLRGAVGAGLGIALAGIVTRLMLGGASAGWPWLVAPIGASAVLVFVVPASPLAQPWSVLGGDMLSALIGLVAAWAVPSPIIAVPLAVAAAIAAMSLCRCLHPPGGACALVGALGGPLTHVHGWAGLLLPLGINVLILIAAGWLYNTMTGHAWPHRQPSPPPLTPAGWTGSYEAEDLDAVLDDWNEVLDVSRDDMDALFRAVERRVQGRWLASKRDQ